MKTIKIEKKSKNREKTKKIQPTRTHACEEKKTFENYTISFREGLHVILGYRRQKSHSAKSEFEQQFLTHTNEQINKHAARMSR